jgi:hypothetical protein
VRDVPSPSGREDAELVRQALDGLFEIACEDRPEPVRRSLRRQIDEMPVKEARTLVEEMVDTDRLADLVASEAADRPERPPSAPGHPARKVDDALEPLVEWTCGEEGAETIRAMADDERMHLLFSSLGRR